MRAGPRRAAAAVGTRAISPGPPGRPGPDSTPTAAVTALYNEYAAARGELNLGFANPILYDLANNPPAQPTFHDVTTGDNLFYSAGVGWDYPTGWGSPYVARMIFELAGSPAPLSVWADRAANNPGGGIPKKAQRSRYPI